MQHQVLVVEDYADLRFAIGATLARDHYRCDCVGTAEDAIAMLREHHYEAILLAPTLPISDDRVLKFLALHQPGELPKVILMTEEPGATPEADCRTLVKPFNHEELLRELPRA